MNDSRLTISKTSGSTARTRRGAGVRPPARRGSAAVLAMMFLVIFGSLAAAMAIVAQGNLATADAQLKINRTLAASETGLHFMMYRTNQITATITTRSGVIDPSNAQSFWDTIRASLLAGFTGELHDVVGDARNPSGQPYEFNWPDASKPVSGGNSLFVGPVALGAGSPSFIALFIPHPIPGENYDSSYYQRPPYSTMTPAASNTSPLDNSWVRLRVEAAEGPAGHQVTRAIQMDFHLEKNIKYAILSNSRVMIGSNVMISGPVGSRYSDVQLQNGHPIQMSSDFRGLAPALDTNLDLLTNTLISNDKDGDNRINLADTRETTGITDPGQFDTDGDGYLTDFDFFLAFYDKSGKGYVNATDLDAASNPRAAQLLALIDTFGDSSRAGYNDGKIDANDSYAKVRGEVYISASLTNWQAGAAGGAYQDHFQGPIVPDYGSNALTFEAGQNANYSFTPSDFDTTALANKATGDLASQASAQAAQHDPDNPGSPGTLTETTFESVPFGSAHPYDYYNRPVYRNMTFTNVRIPVGANALFINCKFIGSTYVQTATDNTDPYFNYAGMLEADGTQKYPTLTATVNGATVSDTKTFGNNVRFDGCTFDGAVASDVPQEYSHVRNKIAFTGTTEFHVQDSAQLSASEKQLYSRSTIMAPQYSVDMGTFIDPNDPSQTVNLSGTIVAGLLDLRGQVNVDGRILTTFKPQSNTGPVMGDTSPQFNTTLGYFSSAQGDLEAELPANGLGKIAVRYNPSIPLPDGILGPISLVPYWSTYFEVGAR